MNASEALGRLRALRAPVITTADAATALKLRTDAASQTLRRLAAAGLVFRVRKGLWALGALPDPASLSEYVTAPYPAYVSLQSALFLRGMIEQVPGVRLRPGCRGQARHPREGTVRSALPVRVPFSQVSHVARARAAQGLSPKSGRELDTPDSVPAFAHVDLPATRGSHRRVKPRRRCACQILVGRVILEEFWQVR
jgi:hypothetical protein